MGFTSFYPTYLNYTNVEGDDKFYLSSSYPDEPTQAAVIKDGEVSYTCIEHHKYGKTLVFNSRGKVPIEGTNPNPGGYYNGVWVTNTNHNTPFATQMYFHEGCFYTTRS